MTYGRLGKFGGFIPTGGIPTDLFTYYTIRNELTQIVNELSWTTKLSLVTPSDAPAGKYILCGNVLARYGTSSDALYGRLRDSYNLSNEILGFKHVDGIEGSQINHSGMDVITAPGGIMTFSIEGMVDTSTTSSTFINCGLSLMYLGT